MNTFIKILIFSAILRFSFQSQANFKIRKKIIKFLNKNTYSLILFCKEKLDYYQDIEKHFKDHIVKFKIITVKDKYISDSYKYLQVKKYPTLRLYFGQIKLFVDYFGVFKMKKNLKDEEYKNEITNIKNNIFIFLNQRFKKSIKRINKNSKNLEKQINYYRKNLPSFVFFRGPEDNYCHQLFVTLSQVIEKSIFLYLEDDLSKELGVISEINDGLYMRLNYKENKNLIKICDCKQKTPLLKKNVLKNYSLINYYSNENLKILSQSDIDELREGEKIIVLNKEFFKSAEKDSELESYLKNLDKHFTKKLRARNFDLKKKKKKIKIFQVEINENGRISYEILLKIVGNAYKKNFVFLFEKKKNSLLKFRFKVKDPLKIDFSISKFIKDTEKLNIRPFIKSDDRLLNFNEKKFFFGKKLKKISKLDVLKLKKDMKNKQFFLYCSDNFNKELLKILENYFKDKKIMVFLLDLNQNDFEKYEEKDYILLKPKNINSFLKIQREFFNEQEEEFHDEDL